MEGLVLTVDTAPNCKPMQENRLKQQGKQLSLSLCSLHRVPHTCRRPGDIIMPSVDLLRAMAEGICVLASRGCERLCCELGHLLGRDADD